jgi:hypothetical protein
MSGNVVDLAKLREEAQQRHAEASQQRLDDAPDIREGLWKTARTEKQDRAILAANLAWICGEATRDEKTSIREIFKAAFGKDFDSKYKKLKRFVCAQDDEPPKEGFAAHGADFVALAEAVASIAHAGQPKDAIAQAKKRAILQLIEGSSFDDKRLPEARRQDEAVGALLEWQDQVLQNIKKDVDLDTMYDAVEHASAAAVFDVEGNPNLLARSVGDWSDGNTPNALETDEQFTARSTQYRFSLLHPAQQDLYKVLRDQIATETACLDDQVASQLLRTVGPNDAPFPVGLWDLDEPDDPDLTREASYAPIAPRVVLGDVLSPIKHDFEERGETGAVTGVVMLDIDEQQIAEALALQAHNYDASVNRHNLVGTAPAFNRHGAHRDLLHKAAVKALAARIGFSERWIAEECTTFDALAWQFSREGRSRKDLHDLWGTEIEDEIVTRRQIELKLMRDIATRNWRLCLALSRGILENFSAREGVYGVKRGSSFEPSFALGYHHDSMPGPEMCSFFLHRVGDNRFMIYGVFGAGGAFDPEWGKTGPEDPVFGIKTGWLPLPSSSAIDALFTPIENPRFGVHGIGAHTINAPLHRHADEYAPAKPDTLAGLILRNHAYAPQEKRYGALLLEDARRKAAMTRDFIERRKKEFDTGMKRAWKTDTME